MAADGLGAWSKVGTSSRRIHVSQVGTLKDAALDFGLPEEPVPSSVRPIVKLRPLTKRLSLSRCTSMSLIQVARGVKEGHFEAGVRLTDVAAASVILAAAHGSFRDWQGRQLYEAESTGTVNLAATNGHFNEELTEVLSKAKSGARTSPDATS